MLEKQSGETPIVLIVIYIYILKIISKLLNRDRNTVYVSRYNLYLRFLSHLRYPQLLYYALYPERLLFYFDILITFLGANDAPRDWLQYVL